MTKYITNNEKIGQEKKPFIDYCLVFVIVALVIFGLVVIYSTTAYEGSISDDKDAFATVRKQFYAVIAGFVAMGVATYIPREFFKKIVGYLYIGTFVLLVLVAIIGSEINGAKRWIKIAGISIQPAELAKVAVIITMAFFICRLEKSLNGTREFWFLFAIPLPLSGATLLFTKDLSSAIIIFLIGYVILYLTSPKTSWVVIIAVGGLAAAALLVFLIVKFPSFPAWDFRGARILAWRNPTLETEAGYQTSQALYAIGSGGVFGKGIGKSVQKLGALPEARSDMVFAIICEELGIVGAFCIIALYVIAIWRMVIIAINAKDLFGALIVIGVMAHLALQVLLNIAVVTNVFPNTGISLPFLSAGGSAEMVMLGEMGLVLNVARDNKF